MGRPDGWDEIRQRLGSDRPSFEAGADAILEALKRNGKYTDGKALTLSINVQPGEKGWLVFIPEEE